MFDKHLPDNFSLQVPDRLMDLAAQSVKSGSYLPATAMLATWYDHGGPVNALEQAYTYLRQLEISRRMLRRTSAKLGGEQAVDTLTNFSTLHDEEDMNRVIGEFDDYLVGLVGHEREPSGALLLLAEKRFTDGAPKQDVLAALPRAEAVRQRADRLASKYYYQTGEDLRAEDYLQRIRANDAHDYTTFHMHGALAIKKGDVEKGADDFERSLSNLLAPVSPGEVPIGRMQFMTTIMEIFDVFAFSGGFAVVRKHPDLVGVTVLGPDIFMVNKSRRYRQWTALKNLAERVVSSERVLTYLRPINDLRKLGGAEQVEKLEANSENDVTSDETNCDFCQRMRLFWQRYAPAKHRIRGLLSAPRCFAQYVVISFYRAILVHWIRAEKVPLRQISGDIDGIYPVINTMIETG